MNDVLIWSVIVALGLGTWLIRFSFIGLIGHRPLPNWAVRLLRYVPVAVLPALATPLVVWPSATAGETDPARISAAVVALAVGAWRRSVLGAVLAGMITLYAALWILG